MKKLIFSLSLFLCFSSLVHAQWTTNATNTITSTSNSIGIGTIPVSLLHVSGLGTAVDHPAQWENQALIIQANTGGRSTTTGAVLEFAIPANTDGTNIWSQARIITVAGNTTTGNAVGKMILGTKRNFDKLGTGYGWYYGNDLVIDGAGRVGINTLTPREALSVNGNIRSKQVTVELANWPDYVFKKDYQLPSLSELKTYIDQNQHLPEIPSEQQIAKEGLNLGEMNKLLMKKVEELTLYLIEKDQKEKKQIETNDILESKLKLQQAEIDELKTQMRKLVKP